MSPATCGCNSCSCTSCASCSCCVRPPPLPDLAFTGLHLYESNFMSIVPVL
ncbi:hypothetical protein PspLS_10826 [Pyricularia sp. CBS 133598]|nr:hypothetical protein PspLS_10826 [Pyricularia sp. CBS 133598]